MNAQAAVGAGTVQADEGTEFRGRLDVEFVLVEVIRRAYCRSVRLCGIVATVLRMSRNKGLSYPLRRRGAAVAAFIVAIGFGELEELEGESRSGEVSVCCPRPPTSTRRLWQKQGMEG